jgi:hypothetical protein
VIVWCSCEQWGYGGPDEALARELHRQHMAEVEGVDGHELSGRA